MPLSYTRLVLLSIEFQRVIISPVIQPHSCQHAFHTTIAYMYNGPLIVLYLHALHSSGCLKGKASPLSMAAIWISGVFTMFQSPSCNKF